MDIEKKTRKNEEESQSKIPYPFQIFFIISMEACERFSYYGMNSKLPALLIDQAHFSYKCFSYFNNLLNSPIRESLWHKGKKYWEFFELKTFTIKIFSESWGRQHNILSHLQVRLLRLWSAGRGAGRLLLREVPHHPLRGHHVRHRPGSPRLRGSGQRRPGHQELSQHVRRRSRL